MYRDIDKNGSGTVGLKEFEAALNVYSKKLSSVDCLLVFSRFDKNGNGLLS